MANNTFLFFELVRVALGTSISLSRSPSDEEWLELFIMAQKQAIAGVVFDSLKELTKYGQIPPRPVLYEMIGISEQIKQQNEIVNKRCLEVIELLADMGFRSTILKGQGNGMMYPRPTSRQPGDIDVWVDGDKKNIITAVHNLYPKSKVREHHVDFPVFKDVDVEVHFFPTFSVVGRFEKRLKMFFDEHRSEQFTNKIQLINGEEINAPTLEFNLIYQMSHMMRHFFAEGIGMRHILDYYFLLLKSYQVTGTKNLTSDFQYFGMKRFAGAVMWVLHDFLGLENRYLLIEPDQKRGELLVDEIIRSGNFGQYDKRLAKDLKGTSATLSILIRNFRFVRLFPEEAISAPITGLIKRFIR